MAKSVANSRRTLRIAISLLFLLLSAALYSQVDKAPVLLEPKTRSVINTPTPTFRWRISSDSEMSYRLVIAEKNGKVIVDTWIDAADSYKLSDSLALKDLSIYYWNVSAFDGENYYPSDNSSFWVDLNISLDLEIRQIRLLNPHDHYRAGDAALFEVEILNAGELPCYGIEVILYNGNLNQNYTSERSYRITERADQKTLGQIDSGKSTTIQMRGQIKPGYNHFYAEVRTTGDYNDVLLFNNVSVGPIIQTFEKQWRLNGLFVIFDKYMSDSLQLLSPQDLDAIYTNIEATRKFFYDHTNVLDINYDTLIMNGKLLSEKDFTYIDEKWGHVLSPEDIATHLNQLLLPLLRYDFVYVFYTWENTRRTWTGYRGYTYGMIRRGIDRYALAAQPVIPGSLDNEEVTIHELLRIIDGFYEDSGITDFHAPDQREQNTTFTNNLDYYTWILETWPSSRWFSLTMGEPVNTTNNLQADTHANNEPFQLFHNYPNPFNNYTTIRYILPEDSLKTSEYAVMLSIYSVIGERVRTLFDGTQKSGIHSFLWDGKDDQGQFVTSGIYLYRLKVDDSILIKKSIFIK